MKQFTNIQNNTYTFSSCETCNAKCCDGREGTLFSQIVLDDFKKVYKNFPILFIFGDLGYLKPVIILTNGKSFCKYLENNRCSIYHIRPTVCRTYPLSANIDNNIYIDELCPAVNDKNEKNQIMVQKQKIFDNFKTEALNNYQDKYINTHFELESFNKKEDFQIAININGINFFKYINKTQNTYINMHLESLKMLEYSYFKDLN